VEQERRMKVHFKDSLERLVEGRDTVVNCGALIPKAKFAGMLDIKILGLQEISGINNCKKCLAVGEKIPERHYFYAIAAGEESLRTEEVA
jgi:hypothetical protein